MTEIKVIEVIDGEHGPEYIISGVAEPLNGYTGYVKLTKHQLRELRKVINGILENE